MVTRVVDKVRTYNEEDECMDFFYFKIHFKQFFLLFLGAILASCPLHLNAKISDKDILELYSVIKERIVRYKDYKAPGSIPEVMVPNSLSRGGRKYNSLEKKLMKAAVQQFLREFHVEEFRGIYQEKEHEYESPGIEFSDGVDSNLHILDVDIDPLPKPYMEYTYSTSLGFYASEGSIITFLHTSDGRKILSCFWVFLSAESACYECASVCTNPQHKEFFIFNNDGTIDKQLSKRFSQLQNGIEDERGTILLLKNFLARNKIKLHREH
jgi:hypothetical protein